MRRPFVILLGVLTLSVAVGPAPSAAVPKASCTAKKLGKLVTQRLDGVVRQFVCIRNGKKYVWVPTRAQTTLPRPTRAPAVVPSPTRSSMPSPTATSSATSLSAISELSTQWVDDDLIFRFIYDPSGPHATAQGFVVTTNARSNSGRSRPGRYPIVAGTREYQYVIAYDDFISTMGWFHADLTQLCVSPVDTQSGRTWPGACVVPGEWLLSLEAPQVRVSPRRNGYEVEVLNVREMEKPQFAFVDVWEIEGNEGSPPTVIMTSDGAGPANFRRVGLRDSPMVSLIASNLNGRWVIARFTSRAAGRTTAFSSPIFVRPQW